MIRFRWIIDDVLAGSHRPGYYDEYGDQVSIYEVDSWIESVKENGINSISCLLHNDQLSYYSSLPSHLLDYYKQKGFEVKHVPAFDHKYPPLNDEQLEEVWKCFQGLPKPVLVHCSAGIDRTGMAVEFIKSRFGK